MQQPNELPYYESVTKPLLSQQQFQRDGFQPSVSLKYLSQPAYQSQTKQNHSLQHLKQILHQTSYLAVSNHQLPKPGQLQQLSASYKLPKPKIPRLYYSRDSNFATSVKPSLLLKLSSVADKLNVEPQLAHSGGQNIGQSERPLPKQTSYSARQPIPPISNTRSNPDPNSNLVPPRDKNHQLSKSPLLPPPLSILTNHHHHQPIISIPSANHESAAATQPLNSKYKLNIASDPYMISQQSPNFRQSTPLSPASPGNAKPTKRRRREDTAPKKKKQQKTTEEAVDNKLISLSEDSVAKNLDNSTIQTWCALGSLANSMQMYDRAIELYEMALKKNSKCLEALIGIAEQYRDKEDFQKAIEYYQNALSVDKSVGSTWEALAHCYLMTDNLPDSYAAYQQALQLLEDPNVPKLWYGIAILYDRYATYDLAKEAFQRVLTIDPTYDKKSDIHFRLGIIYKHEQNYQLALENFRMILHTPPAPLSEVDIWFQIGHIYEVLEDYPAAQQAYEHILKENPAHAKVLQQLGWLHYQQYMKNTQRQLGSVKEQETHLELAISQLSQSLDYEPTDGYTWYLLGRSLMQQDRHSQAYAAYQQAVYRDSQNPRFWCSIGILYFRIAQYRDALDAYTRAIRLAPDSLPEVWYNAAILYEVSNNQIQDAVAAVENAVQADPSNPIYSAHLRALHAQRSSGVTDSKSVIPEELRIPREPSVPVDRPLPPPQSTSPGATRKPTHPPPGAPRPSSGSAPSSAFVPIAPAPAGV